jgi:hypothetical protein
MFTTYLLLLLPLLSATTLATHAPPHLRHRRLASETIRHVKADQPVYLPRAISARANEAHADAHRSIKRTVMKRGQQCRHKSFTASISLATQVATTTVVTSTSTQVTSTDSAVTATSTSTVDQQQASAQVSYSSHALSLQRMLKH